jgi:hypothetical protein
LLTIVVPILYGEETVWYPSINVHKLNSTTLRTGEWDLIWVSILAVFCTNCTFYMSTKALRHISAFTSNLISNLEPIYGIILGAVIFHENQSLNFHFYIGTAIILGAVFSSSIVSELVRSRGATDQSAVNRGEHCSTIVSDSQIFESLPAAAMEDDTNCTDSPSAFSGFDFINKSNEGNKEEEGLELRPLSIITPASFRPAVGEDGLGAYVNVATTDEMETV